MKLERFLILLIIARAVVYTIAWGFLIAMGVLVYLA